MGPLYNFGIALYSGAARLAASRSPKVEKMIKGQRDSLTLLDKKSPQDGFDVWIHASSLGEFEQARPLIERLRREKPHLTILLTFFSPSGYEVRKNYDQVDAVAYLPFDSPNNVHRFLDCIKPKKAIFVKYEFWGNYLQQLQKRGIPTYIISSIFRPGQIFFKPWGGVFRRMLKRFDHLYVQDAASQSLLHGIGIDNVTVAGDTRFDRVTDIMRTTATFPMIENWTKDHKVLIAGSSWEPDEEYYLPYINAHPEIRLIIAPHEFNEERLKKIEMQLQRRSQRMSQIADGGKIDDEVQTLIVDCFGKLSSLYRYGSVALIGGGFGAGIHNINEAAVYGMPVVFGPKHYKFKEAADLLACGGASEYHDALSLKTILDGYFANDDNDALLKTAGQAAGRYIKQHLGATDLIYADLFCQ